MTFPKWENTIVKIIWIYATIGLGVIYWNSFGVEHKLLGNGVYLFDVPLPAVLAIAGFTTPTMLFIAIVFLWHFFKSRVYWSYKFRGLILGAGMVLYLTSGPAHNIIKTPTGTIIVDSLLIVTGILFLIGIYLPRVFPELETQKPYVEPKK